MVVMKFGGTSVGDAAAIKRLVSIVRQRLYDLSFAKTRSPEGH